MLEDLDPDMVQSVAAACRFLPSLQSLKPIHGFANLEFHYRDLSAILRRWDGQRHEVRSEAPGMTIGSNETPVGVQYLSMHAENNESLPQCVDGPQTNL